MRIYLSVTRALLHMSGQRATVSRALKRTE
jgi:hypothetical protein